MDDTLERFNAIKWLYAPKDPKALTELEQRIAEIARKRSLITYSDLIRGVTFSLSNLKDGQHRIDPAEWQELDRAIIGDFLGYLSMRSYEAAGFFSSALVVTKTDGSPGEGFYTLLRELGLVSKAKTDKAMYLWADHVAKAHTWYARQAAQS